MLPYYLYSEIFTTGIYKIITKKPSKKKHKGKKKRLKSPTYLCNRAHYAKFFLVQYNLSFLNNSQFYYIKL